MATRNPLTKVVAACLPALAWMATVAVAAPAHGHHGTPIGRTGGVATPPPAPPPASPPATAAPTPPPAFSGTLETGASGDAVLALEQRLDALRYWMPNVDGEFDDDTRQAVIAFQKANDLERTGTVDQRVWEAMQSAGTPAPLVPAGAGHRVEIDLARQVLYLYEGGQLSRIFPVATGTTATPTPTGDYAIYRRAWGWETSRLGRLYNSQYFVGGYAIHGSLSVPARPASHGCVRLTMSAAEWFPDHVGMGTPVHVR